MKLTKLLFLLSAAIIYGCSPTNVTNEAEISQELAIDYTPKRVRSN